ncbi:MAG: radical SAM family heme chaperone HemW [Pelovirga sp.]
MSSLYFHIPFCRSRCHYCDFFSTTAGTTERSNYVALLVQHLQLLESTRATNTDLQTIYFGGGTPSLLTVEQLERLLTACDELFGVAANAEITIEVNPGTFDRFYLQQIRSLGFNRLSIGVQSFDAEQLHRLGRCYSREQVLEAVPAARSAGFDNFSLDLMFALPEQTTQQLDREIKLLLQLEPGHISVYGLTVEEGTEFERLQRRGQLAVVAEEEYARQYELLRERFDTAGYEHYEVSNFARPGYRCHHNQRYWQRRHCLAVGCGAHSFLEKGYGERWHIPADLPRYQQNLEGNRNPAEKLEVFDRTEAMRETAYLALRTSDGIDLDAFEQRFGESFHDVFSSPVAALKGVLRQSSQQVAFQPQHWLIYDHLISPFL